MLQSVFAGRTRRDCLIGPATEKNYRTLAAIGKADKHKLIGEAPVDINIAKQINILLQDAGFDLNDVVMCPGHRRARLWVRLRLHHLRARAHRRNPKGDKHMALPQIANVGWETWKVKEALADEDVLPGWGRLEQRGPRWEATAAAGYIQAGADILTLAHPRSNRSHRNHQRNSWRNEMILIGERINTGFKDIKQAVLDKNPAPLQDWAKKQSEAGAHYLDVNLGAVSRLSRGHGLDDRAGASRHGHTCLD